MDYDFTPSQLAWRDEVRAFIRENVDPGLASETRLKGNEGRGPLALAFHRALRDAGWWGIAWPKEYGGLGKSAVEQWIFIDEIESAGAPMLPLTVTSVAPTIMKVGDDAQKRHWLPRINAGEVDFALGYSEPEAGTDMASLRTRAELDGDEWVVNGQKVWTTLAHLSRWGLLVVRTDTEAVKHAGLTAFVVDMHDPTVDVRPLRQMTGEAEFNEVYFTDTRIPDREMLGSPGDGWRVSLTTLMNERVSIGGTIPQRGSGTIAHLMSTWSSAADWKKDAAARDRVVQLWIRAETLRLTNIRANQNRRLGDPGPEGSIGKMASANLNKDIYECLIDLMGADGLLYGSYEMIRPEHAMEYATPQKAFLRSRANSIEGGTTEVMLNILGERVLGLPGDVRVDREKPWSQVRSEGTRLNSSHRT